MKCKHYWIVRATEDGPRIYCGKVLEMPNKTEIEKMFEEKAVELWGVYFEGSGWKGINYPSNQGQKIAMTRLAKFVLKSQLMARLEELNTYIPLSRLQRQRIDEILQQIGDLDEKG